MNKEYDVIGIGNPLLDIIIEVDDGILHGNGLKKGEMHLVDGEQGKKILESLDAYAKAYVSGGSAANTVAGVALLGGKSSFVGVVGDDLHGAMYEEDMSNGGVHTNLHRHESENTGYAITFVTRGGERTFATCLGAAGCLRREHLSEDDIKKSKILHIEGYLLLGEETRETVLMAMKCAKKHDTLVSIDLSASGVIRSHLDLIREIISEYVDIVFVNEEEAFALTGKSDVEALHQISESCPIAVVKLGEKGSLVKRHGKVHAIDPHPVVMVNTNGAGDMYAAGFLHGLAQGHDTEVVGSVASEVAGLVVSSEGARMHASHHGKIENILKKYKRHDDA